jgi:hypothetical protein
MQTQHQLPPLVTPPQGQSISSRVSCLDSLANVEWWHRRGEAPISRRTLSPVATHGLFCYLFLIGMT